MTRPLIFAVAICASALPAAAQQTFTGRLSDNRCGVSHQPKAGGLSDRECLFACVNGLAKYVLVDPDGRVVPIVNQDAIGLPLYAGRPVKLTGERTGDGVVVTKVEAIPAHLHVGHVMTNWRDTPGLRGFLPVARLAAKSASLDEAKLHAGHALNALDPAVEPKGPSGPGAGYGIRKAVAGAIQHLDFAARAEGATPSITTHAASASSSLSAALRLVDEAVAAAQRIRAATEPAAAAAAAAELAALTGEISGTELQDAQAHLAAMLKAEGLAGAPRD